MVTALIGAPIFVYLARRQKVTLMTTSAIMQAQHVRRTTLARRHPVAMMIALGVLALVLSFSA